MLETLTAEVSLGDLGKSLQAVPTASAWPLFKTKGECEAAVEAHRNPLRGRFLDVAVPSRDRRGPKGK